MGLIEGLPQQPHHIRLKTTDKEGRTGILRPLELGWVDTSRNISTGTVPPPRSQGGPDSPWNSPLSPSNRRAIFEWKPKLKIQLTTLNLSGKRGT
jgi:hypothetical protein